MARFVGRHIAPEMLALGLIELLLTFSLAYILLTPASGGLVLEMQAANHALVVALTIGFVAFTIGLYRSQVFTRASSVVVNTILTGLLAFPAIWIVSKVAGVSSYWPVGYDALRPLKILLIWIAALLSVRFLFMVAVRLNVFVHRVAILDPAEASGTVAAIRAGRKGFLDVALREDLATNPAALQQAGFRTVILPGTLEGETGTALVQQLREHGIRADTQAGFWERCLKRIDIETVDAAWLERLDRREPSRLEGALVRVADIALSLVLLLVTLPLMLLVALLVRLDSAGPILYRQERVGLDGVAFTLLKFRSMRVNAETRGPAWAQQHDPRVTRVGLFMRRTRIDELPQLLNILKGQMSFIGPRPERPHFVEQLSGVIPHYRERARVKPGLTGWAQVNYPYGASVEDARAKLSYDLYYVKNRSLFLDILILFATVRVIMFQEGAR